MAGVIFFCGNTIGDWLLCERDQDARSRTAQCAGIRPGATVLNMCTRTVGIPITHGLQRASIYIQI